MFFKQAPVLLHQLSSIARTPLTRFFSQKSTIPKRVLPSLIFAENHSDPVLGRVLKRLTPRFKAMTYNQFLDEKGQEVTLPCIVHSNEEDRSRYQALAHLFKKHNLDINNPADVSLFAAQFQLSSELIHHLRVFVRGSSSFLPFLRLLEKEKLAYQGIDLSDYTLEQALMLPRVMNARDSHMSKHYLHHQNNCFGRIGLMHVEGIQHRIVRQRGLKDAKDEYLFFYVYSIAATKCQAYETAVQNGAINFPLGLTLLNARNRKLDDITDEIELKVAQQVMHNAKKYQSPLPSPHFTPFT